jgi:protein tyrosine phosphatase type 4A
MKRTPFSSRSGVHSHLPNPPTLIEHQGMRFLIMDSPSESNLQLYLKEMERYDVAHLVRVCEPTYAKESVEQKGIIMHDWVFPDGEAPPASVVHNWLTLINQVFPNSPIATTSIQFSSNSLSQNGCSESFANDSVAESMDSESIDKSSCTRTLNTNPAIAVHCIAGLGRAPVLVALALVESGMEPLESVEFIRQKRRGAINLNQLKFLEAYSRRRKGSAKCTIM